MNRETKRMMQRQGQVAPDGTPARREPSPRPTPRPAADRLRAGAYFREVRAELRKVAWPTRPEVINYSVIVLIALVLLSGLIFGFDYVFGKGVFFLFNT